MFELSSVARRYRQIRMTTFVALQIAMFLKKIMPGQIKLIKTWDAKLVTDRGRGRTGIILYIFRLISSIMLRNTQIFT